MMKLRLAVAALFAAVLPLHGCSGCGDVTAVEVPVAAEQPVAVAEDPLAPLAGRTAPAQAPATGIVYTVPTECVLRYAFELRGTQDPPPKAFGVPQATGVRIGGTFELSARPGGAQITLGRRTTAPSADGPGGLETVVPAGHAAPVHLVLDDGGRRWVEVDGPTVSWATQRIFSGLAVFFPTVPASTAVGESVGWRSDLAASGAMAETEAARGKPQPGDDFFMGPPEPKRRDFETRVAGWVAVDGKLAARLQTRGTLNETREGMVEVKIASTFEGQSLVLASGALLSGTARKVMTVSRRFRDGQTDDTTATLSQTVRLVEGCGDMPVAAPLAPVHAPRRAVLDAWAQVIRGLDKDDTKGALAPFSDELREAHGDQLLATLQRHVTFFKLEALGRTQGVEDVVLEGTRVIAMVEGKTYFLKPHGGERWRVATRVEGRVDADGGVTLTAVGTDNVREYEKPRVLEISTERIFSAAPK